MGLGLICNGWMIDDLARPYGCGWMAGQRDFADNKVQI